MSDPITNRYEFIFLFDVENGNPNGDPDFANHPRMDPQDQHGLVSDVAVKRRIRNFVQMKKDNEFPNSIFIQHATNLNTAIAKSHEETGGIETDTDGSVKAAGKEKVASAREWMCKNFFDVRTFGAVMSTGPNAGQVRGPVQIAFSRSVDPIHVMDVTVSRMAATINVKNATSSSDYQRAEDDTPEDKLRTFGRKSVVPYALFVGKGFLSANLAKQTGFSKDDLNLFFDALKNMYEHDRSSSKGLMTVRDIIVFKHVGTRNGNEGQQQNQAMLGCAHAQDLFDLVVIKQDEEAMVQDGAKLPRRYSHYEVSVLEKECPTGVEILRIPRDSNKL